MRPVLPILSVLVLLLGLPSGVAQARDETPGRAQRNLRGLAVRIAGGASLLAGVASSHQTQDFNDRARHFEESLGRGATT